MEQKENRPNSLRSAERMDIPLFNGIAIDIFEEMVEQNNLVTEHLVRSFAQYYASGISNDSTMYSQISSSIFDMGSKSDERALYIKDFFSYIRTEYEIQKNESKKEFKNRRSGHNHERDAQVYVARELLVNACKKVSTDSDIDQAQFNDVVSRIVMGML